MKNTHTSSPTVYAVAIAVAVALGGSGFWYVTRPPVGDDPVFSRKVLDYREVPAEDGGLAVQYSYVGERLPDRLERNEIPELRTESSYVVEIAEPTKDKRTFEGRFFPQEAFVRENGAWYYKESATTTPTAFNILKRRNPFAELLIPKAQAYSASPYSTSGDGQIAQGNSTSWSTVHDATSGVSAQAANTTAVTGVTYETSGNFAVIRAFFPFQTDSIPVSATIVSASLNIKPTQAHAIDDDGLAYLTVVQTSQTTHTTLATADFDTCGSVTSPTEGVASGERKNLASIVDGTYLPFELNATGRGWIKKNGQSSNCSSTSGITCLGVREGHDTTNTATNVQDDNNGTFAEFWTSEASGITNDPYLSVTFTLPPGTYRFSESFTTAGYAAWTPPATITSANVACWGGGGGGGDGSNTGGGGGGGGAFASSTVAVTPGTLYTLFIGSGGLGADVSSNASGSNGTASTFSTTTVVAAGGTGGSGGSSNDPSGGAGGTTAASTGDVEFAGGAGAAGSNSTDKGGGAGGAGGPNGAGEAGSVGTGVTGSQRGGRGDNNLGGAFGTGGNGTHGGAGGAGTFGGGGGGGGDNGFAGGAGGAVGGGGAGGELGGGSGASGGCYITYDLVVASPVSFWQWMDF